MDGASERERMLEGDAHAHAQVVLVTGCAKGGIGHEYVRTFQAAGCRVFATDVLDPAAGTMAELQKLARVTALKMDVTSQASVEEAVQLVLFHSGRIDIVVNNAGVGAMGPLAEMPLSSVARNFDVNVTGMVRVVQAVTPVMARQKRGKIVNIGSVVGYVATPWAGSYCATKAAVHSLTDTLRVELQPLGIQVMLVVPGSVRSGFGSANLKALEQQPKYRLYAQYEGAVRERAAASQVGKATPTDEFAKAVVAAVLQSRLPRHFKYGHLTGFFTILQWAPLSIRDSFMTMRFMKTNTIEDGSQPKSS